MIRSDSFEDGSGCVSFMLAFFYTFFDLGTFFSHLFGVVGGAIFYCAARVIVAST